MYGAFHTLLVIGSEVAGDENVAAHTQSVEQRDQQKAKGAGGADGGKGLLAGKTTDDHGVGGVEQHLQEVGQHQRDREDPDVFQQRTLEHIRGLVLSIRHN